MNSIVANTVAQTIRTAVHRMNDPLHTTRVLEMAFFQERVRRETAAVAYVDRWLAYGPEAALFGLDSDGTKMDDALAHAIEREMLRRGL